MKKIVILKVWSKKQSKDDSSGRLNWLWWGGWDPWSSWAQWQPWGKYFRICKIAEITITFTGPGRTDETARPWLVWQRWRGGELTWWAVVEVHLEQTELTSECHTVIHCYKYNCNSVWFIPLIILESFHLFKKFSGKAHQNFNFQCLCF